MSNEEQPVTVTLAALFRPLKGPLEHGSVRVRTLRWEEVTVGYGDRVLWPSLPGGYIFEALRRHGSKSKKTAGDIKDLPLTLVEVRNRQATGVSVLALLDLLTPQHRFLLDEKIRSAQPLPKDVAFHALGKPTLHEFQPRLVQELDFAIRVGVKYQRFSIAIQRWHAALQRTTAIDAVIDCCSSLDAVFHVQNELRLRLALGVMKFVRKNKRAAGELVYKMYGARNDFVHGSRMPTVADEDWRSIVSLTAQVLRQVAAKGSLPTEQSLPW